ncbi:amino acid ABC transporter permease [Edwardsiella ictaluri]|uniref:Amino acid ABC transporter, permease protein, putative n=1 Tax=Edwardsiella ictaluri (strain 93-146) TaxID=634503 RepID=C5B979_EDWI9|nr:amino acid ABC transporter permease [Edwardsiella ictaluri]ACR70819.1 amino acid ABC transporter, permease protein, putative [Edwardsiella ictaluri 93-146]ARD39686.1 amino acid ABC transporter permease [Edwardsiella ictaluri]AVZ82394.1 amino acid ABC transporter permease [Edwardsiella ictaluri]EKS7762922.1 amino acid ABC transporter permease [Edwardsiella ictaluri]EKS7769834.1 amino acid ABC transporter permease [Edwardsiella ictaluri]
MFNQWMSFQSDLIDQFPLILDGLWHTLMLAGVVSITGLLGGMLLLYMKISRRKWLIRSVDGYISFFVGTPLIVLLFVVYYGLPNYGVHLSSFAVAVLGFTLNVSAYNASYLYSAWLGLDEAELRAARAQGFTDLQVYWHIVLPQVFSRSTPSLTNQVIANLKDSSYAFLIGFIDFFSRIQEVASTNFQFFHAYLFAALSYIAMVSVIVLSARQLEKRGIPSRG